MPTREKIVGMMIPAALFAVGFYFWGNIAPFVLATLKNTFWILGYAAIFGIGLLNYTTLKLWYIGFCKGIGNFFVNTDPISIMRGYLHTLKKKFDNLTEAKRVISGKRVEIERIINEKATLHKELQEKAIAAHDLGRMLDAESNSAKALEVEKSIKIYKPIYDRCIKVETFLNDLHENWRIRIDKLQFTIDLKIEEFNNLKKIYKGLKSSEDFLNSNSEEAQLFGQSLKALEEDVSYRIAYMEEFEKNASPIIQDMKLSKQIDQNQAIKNLEEMIKRKDLKLPDYTGNFVTVKKEVETIPYTETKNKYA